MGFFSPKMCDTWGLSVQTQWNQPITDYSVRPKSYFFFTYFATRLPRLVSQPIRLQLSVLAKYLLYSFFFSPSHSLTCLSKGVILSYEMLYLPLTHPHQSTWHGKHVHHKYLLPSMGGEGLLPHACLKGEEPPFSLFWWGEIEFLLLSCTEFKSS